MRSALLAALSASLAGCQGEPEYATREEALQGLIDGIVADDDRVPGVILQVQADDLVFHGSAGRFAHGGAPLDPGDLFRAASITKTFTAAALFKMNEDGELSLDAPVSGLLSSGSTAALRDGGYDPDAISTRQLLQHTAGIFDYTEAAAFYEAIDADPAHAWTRAEQLDLAMSADEAGKLNEPGEAYAYGDTHYILAGEIIERRSGQDLQAAFARYLGFADLGVAETWMETLGEAPTAVTADRISHPYLGDVDTRAWHASWDLWGGGGLVTSTTDLLRLHEALFTVGAGGVFAREETLAAMLEVPAVSEGAFFGLDGAAGISRFDGEDLGVCYAGFGFFSTVYVRCPEVGLAFAATENQAEPRHPDALLDGVLGIFGE